MEIHDLLLILKFLKEFYCCLQRQECDDECSFAPSQHFRAICESFVHPVSTLANPTKILQLITADSKGFMGTHEYS